MSELKNGEFERFINCDTNDYLNNLPMIIKGLHYKMTFLKDMYDLSVKSYKELNQDDPLKNSISNFINNIINYAENTLNQCDLILLDYEDLDLMELEENNNNTDDNNDDGFIMDSKEDFRL